MSLKITYEKYGNIWRSCGHYGKNVDLISEERSVEKKKGEWERGGEEEPRSGVLEVGLTINSV